MANTRQSTKRARQAERRQQANARVRTGTRTTIKKALAAIASKKSAEAKKAYLAAVTALDKAVSKGVFPRGRASRKISRLTAMAKKAMPDILKPNAPSK